MRGSQPKREQFVERGLLVHQCVRSVKRHFELEAACMVLHPRRRVRNEFQRKLQRHRRGRQFRL